MRDLFDSGITPAMVADLTPAQALAVLFEPTPKPTPGDAVEALYAINQERAAKGERPAVPHWWADHLPRAKR